MSNDRPDSPDQRDAPLEDDLTTDGEQPNQPERPDNSDAKVLESQEEEGPAGD